MRTNEATEQFYRLFRGRITLADFENWLYYTPNLEELLGNEFYLSLLEVNYRREDARHEVENVVYSYIPLSYFEEFHITSLLQESIQGSSEVVILLKSFYDEYRWGYEFLWDLAYLYFPFINGTDEMEWYGIVERTLPVLKFEAQRVLSFLESGEIRITGDHVYEDHRKPD